MIFNEEMARTYDEWLRTPAGRYVDEQEKRLITDLLVPRERETVLDVGCGTGEHLLLFRSKGCDVTGIDPSAPMLAIAGDKLGQRATLHQGKAEDLPFDDNEFDIVTLITALEFTDDPRKAIREAIRVCRGRVFLGVLNRYSLTATWRRFKGLFAPTIYDHARFFHIGELTAIIRSEMPAAAVSWGSVIFLPCGANEFARSIDEAIPVMKNPLGAFLGLSFPVTFRYRTVQNIITDPFSIKSESGQPARGMVREIQK
ncbi:MAG: class I SAM-dependent methyltransferase [Deltaproteobacteria bacterium]|jgi:SAM-dependent methyltransferase|nr:class I SAM-dependent methyltransferase [Deltaproteobacteria bacterium]